MNIDFTKRFIKMYGQLRLSDQKRFDQRLELWQKDPRSRVLHDHALKGSFSGARSINIRSDLRAVYRLSDDEKLARFELIGTHNQLYG